MKWLRYKLSDRACAQHLKGPEFGEKEGRRKGEKEGRQEGRKAGKQASQHKTQGHLYKYEHTSPVKRRLIIIQHSSQNRF